MPRLRTLVLSFAVALTTFVVTHLFRFPGSIRYLMDATGGRKILDMQASGSADETYARLEAFGELGRELYLRAILTVDLVFPVSVFVFLLLLARFVSEQARLRGLFKGALQLLPVAYVLLDFCENVSVLLMLVHYPERLEFLAGTVGYLTRGKRVAMMAAMLLPIALWLVTKLRALRAPPHAPSPDNPGMGS
jgi:hypothetical protein